MTEKKPNADGEITDGLLVAKEDSLATRLNLLRRYLIGNSVPKAGQRKATAQGEASYSFVAWDDVAEVVGDAMARHGIVSTASVLEWSVTEAQTRSGKPTRSWVVKVRILLVSSDSKITFEPFLGDSWTAEWVGGADDPETATGLSKATTYAVKDFLLKSNFLAGDDSDKNTRADDSPLGAAAADSVPCPKCGIGRIVQKMGDQGAWLGCSAWKPQSKGCNWRGQGTLAAYLDRERAKEEAQKPSGEFHQGPDGEPVSTPAGQTPPAAEKPKWSEAQMAVLVAIRDAPDKAAARVALIGAGAMSLINQSASDDSKLVIKEAVLRTMDEKALKKALAALEMDSGPPPVPEPEAAPAPTGASPATLPGLDPPGDIDPDDIPF